MCDEIILLNNISLCNECVGVNGEDPEMCRLCPRSSGISKTDAEAFKAYMEAENSTCEVNV